MEKQTIGKFIATLRKANGMTQQDLADKLCVSNKSVSKWECDEGYPDLSLIPVIAEIFGVTADEILKGARKSNNEPTIADPIKTEKQIDMLIQKTITKFRNLSLIAVFLTLTSLFFFVFITSIAVSFIGVTAASIIGILTQIAFKNLAYSAIGNSDIAKEENNKLFRANKLIETYTFFIIFINAIILLIKTIFMFV